LTTAVPFRENFEQHPDHQAQIYGVKLPYWNEVIDCATDTLRKLPYTRFVGLDLAMTTTGPIIIEVNVSPDKNGAANGMISSDIIKQAAQECTLID
jgi:glutathione synthase/RimK-type ligase-like ATP-grasp enzyme